MRTARLPPLLPYQEKILASTSPLLLFLAGVGAGKTHGLGAMCLRGMAEQAGCESAIFAPSYRLFKRVTLPAFQRIVPSYLYSWHPGDQEIHWINGSVTYCIGVDRTPESRIVGMNLAWAVWDEPGASRNGGIIGLITERLRYGDPALRFLALVTSPHGHGWLEDWSSHGVEIINASTYDNPHLDNAYIELLEREYPPGTILHEQEMMGKFVSKTGKVYGDVFSRHQHTTVWDEPRGDYILTVDPGFRASAWLAWSRRMGGPWTVIREWLPEGETTERSAERVRREMGRPPAKVLMDTPSRQNSRLHVNDFEAIRDVMGRRCKVRVLGGTERSSDWRHKAVVAGLTSGALKISEGLCPARVARDERGLVHALETMEWPSSSTRDERQDEKDSRKHVLDALEFGGAVLTPPKLARSEDRLRHYRRAA